MNYDFDECVSRLIDKYYMLREDLIKNELEDAVANLSDDGMDINNETVLRQFDGQMEYYFNEVYPRDINFWEYSTSEID